MPEPVARFLRTLDPGPADAELLRRFAESRDQTAFELLVWRHAGMVQAAAFAVLRDRHLAEDAAQAAFLALARRAGSVRANPSGWLYRTVRRAALGMRRPVGPAVPDVPAPDVRHSRTYEDVAALHDELARLPDRYRLPVLLCLVEGLTHPAAAARLGWPVGTVAGRLSRAKALLRDRLTRRGVTAGLAVAPLAGGGWVSATAAASSAFAAGNIVNVSPSVLLVAKGLVRAMTVTKWATAAGLFLATAVVTGGGLVAVGQPPVENPAVPAAGGLPASAPTDPRPRPNYDQRQRSLAALRQIGQALLDYEQIAGRYPGNFQVGGPNDRRSVLSWRVAVLPFLGHQALYKKFRLNEPWDGPTNKPLLAEMPDVYRLPFQPMGATDTYFQGFAGPGTLFDPARAVRVADVTDGTVNTIGVAEVGLPVPWTKPQDLEYDPNKRFPGVWPFATVRNVGTASGDAYPLATDIREQTLRRLVGIADGQVPPQWDDLRPRLPAETPTEKAELARALAETPRLITELGELLKRVPSVDEAKDWNEELRYMIARLKPKPAEPPAK